MKAKPLAGVSLAEDQLLAARQQSQHQAETSGSLSSQETTAVVARLRFSKSFLQVQLDVTSLLVITFMVWTCHLCKQPLGMLCTHAFAQATHALCSCMHVS